MSKLEEKVNEILGIEKEVEKVEKEFKPLVPRKEDKQKEDVDNDYKYSRENYYNVKILEHNYRLKKHHANVLISYLCKLTYHQVLK